MSTLALSLSVARSTTFRLELELEVEEGVTVLFGPSGSGKSTVLSCVAGLLRPERGRVSLSGRKLFDDSEEISVPPHLRGIALVSQEGLLFPHLSVLSNLRYGASRALAKAGKLGEDEVVSALELEPFLERRPRELSGGERQRVALGRALLSGPDALLLDEPLAALDRERRARIVPYLERVRARAKVPILYVTHALDEALALGERACVLCEGKKVAEGSPIEVFGAPRSELLARLS
ncbi:ATP-binding cassette domain-containing protein, partial [bacterium]|nr:ATP-binding cassette domain-containing protein [bacterium]